MIIPGFLLRHARTVASSASSSVKSDVSSNKATHRKGRVVPTLLTSSRTSNVVVACYQPNRTHNKKHVVENRKGPSANIEKILSHLTTQRTRTG